MRELVIGADGFVGARLKELSGAVGTTRRKPKRRGPKRRNSTRAGTHHLDLLAIDEAKLPVADVVYLCAGVNGTMNCEGNRPSWYVNVDAPLQLARHYGGRGAFVVIISSTTVEWSGSAYARQRAQVEAALFGNPNVGIVRAGRVTRDNRDDLCAVMMRIGRGGVAGIAMWNRDEQPYAK
jgi:dTDP-4-dehydrorhamnose reductase